MSTGLFAGRRPLGYLIRRLLFPTRVNRALENTVSIGIYLQDLIQKMDFLAGIQALLILIGFVLGGLASRWGLPGLVTATLVAHLLSAVTEESIYRPQILRDSMSIANRFFSGIMTGALIALVFLIGRTLGGLAGGAIAILLLIMVSYGLKELASKKGRMYN